MRVRLFQCRISTSASGPATPHNIENYSNELLYMLSGYFKTSVLDFVQQLNKDLCLYQYLQSIGHSDNLGQKFVERYINSYIFYIYSRILYEIVSPPAPAIQC